MSAPLGWGCQPPFVFLFFSFKMKDLSLHFSFPVKEIFVTADSCTRNLKSAVGETLNDPRTMLLLFILSDTHRYSGMSINIF